MENQIIKLIYSQLETDKLTLEIELERVINTPMELQHSICIEILKEIVLTKEAIKTLDNYLIKEA